MMSAKIASFSIIGIGIFVLLFTIVLFVFDLIIPQNIYKGIDPKISQGLNIFINLFKDIFDFLIRKSFFIIFFVAQGYICINEFNNFIENKTLIDEGKITQGYNLFIKETYYAANRHKSYDLYFDYFNEYKNKTIRDNVDSFGDMRSKKNVKLIYLKNKVKVYDEVIYELQPHRIIINLFFIFILVSPLLIFIWFTTWKDNNYKISLSSIKNWFVGLFDVMFTMHDLRDDYTYQNFKAQLQLLILTISNNKFIKKIILIIFFNFILNTSLIYFGYFDSSRLKDTTTPIYFTPKSKPINTLVKGDRYIYIYKNRNQYFCIDSFDKNPKKSYIGHIVPTSDYVLRIESEYDDNKRQFEDMILNLNNMTLKEYSLSSQIFLPYYLPFYKFDPSGTNYKLYGFSDYQQSSIKSTYLKWNKRSKKEIDDDFRKLFRNMSISRSQHPSKF
jgi:hypothetical protein